MSKPYKQDIDVEWFEVAPWAVRGEECPEAISRPMIYLSGQSKKHISTQTISDKALTEMDEIMIPVGDGARHDKTNPGGLKA